MNTKPSNHGLCVNCKTSPTPLANHIIVRVKWILMYKLIFINSLSLINPVLNNSNTKLWLNNGLILMGVPLWCRLDKIRACTMYINFCRLVAYVWEECGQNKSGLYLSYGRENSVSPYITFICGSIWTFIFHLEFEKKAISGGCWNQNTRYWWGFWIVSDFSSWASVEATFKQRNDKLSMISW